MSRVLFLADLQVPLTVFALDYIVSYPSESITQVCIWMMPLMAVVTC